MASNLYQYYTGMGQALPSVSTLAPVFEKYGLGSASGYTGSAQQNTALLSKLQGGGSPQSGPAGGGYTSTPATQAPAPAPSQGYAQTPSGSPQPVQNDPGYNELTNFATSNAADRAALVGKLNTNLSGEYGTLSDQTGLTGNQALLKNLTDQYSLAGTNLADLPTAINKSVQGTFANDAQRTGEIASSSVPYQQTLSKLAIALPGASQAVTNSMNQTNTQYSAYQNAQARELSGFDKSSENELAAIQAKVARGQALTDQEFQRETTLSQAKIGYDAATEAARTTAAGNVSAAGATAGATMAAAKTTADALTNNTATTTKANLDTVALKLGYSTWDSFQNANPGKITDAGVQSLISQVTNGIANNGGGTGSNGFSLPPTSSGSFIKPANPGDYTRTGIGYGVDSNGYTLNKDGTLVKDTVGDGKNHNK